MSKFQPVVEFIRSQFNTRSFIPLHEPKFFGNEKSYVLDAITSTFVSSVGKYVNQFEEMIAQIAGTKYAVATVNGTAALHTALKVAGVKKDEEVLTQALTFVATVNAIRYVDAHPYFIDVDEVTMGMSAKKLRAYLDENAVLKHGMAYNKKTKKKISACVPMHTFGFPCEIVEIASICKIWNITLIEDAAESIGSCFNGKHTGGFGEIGTFSFNGNKTITCGGGGAIVTNNAHLAKLAKHLTTQAKLPHQWEFNHDAVGFNYRMPNLNAALGCAQLEQLSQFVERKRMLAEAYSQFFQSQDILFKKEPPGAKANYWLNAVQLRNKQERDLFLAYTNKKGVMTRPIWRLMHELPMFCNYGHDGLEVSKLLSDRIVNIPSSVLA